MCKHSYALPFVLTAILSAPVSNAIAQPSPWQDVEHFTLAAGDNATYQRAVRLTTPLATLLPQPIEPYQSWRISLPLPEGGFTTFTMTDAGTLPADLQQRFPRLFSLKGSDSQGRQVRFDLSPYGLYAMIFDPQGTWFVHPEGVSGDNLYLSTRRAPAVAAPWAAQAQPINAAGALNAYREYRIGVATTSVFSAHFGGTVEGALASVTRTINRVNHVFERDVGIHLTLVADNDKLMFIDPATDPYLQTDENDEHHSNGSINVEVLKRIIGNENFDLGHVFSNSDGAAPGKVCEDNENDSSHKAYAASGDYFSDAPPGYPLYNEYDFAMLVAHEIGHQFSADHTFNGCVRDSPDTAVSPGSGSTIMSYANGCYLLTQWPPEQNELHRLQLHKDSYFHAISIDQIKSYVSSGTGSQCGIQRGHATRPPVIDPRSFNPHGSAVLTIPARTPFVLRGYASSTQPDARLTYTWEQTDLGPEQPESETLKDVGAGPLFRSFAPSTSGERVLPKWSTLLGQAPLDLGETYPTTTRALNFRLTVRDNVLGEPGTATGSMRVNVVDTGRAFQVDRHENRVWRGGQQRLVNWQVADTHVAPVACPTVRIDLSVDGGLNWLPEPLRDNVANQGQTLITVPRLASDTSAARVRISCSNNLFFAVSPMDFTIVK